jgi:signal peptidase
MKKRYAKCLKRAGKIAYWLVLISLSLVAVFVAFSAFNIPGGFKLFTVQSGSMAPAIKTGSLVVVKSAPEYAVGDVITFKNAPAPTTHRIESIEDGVITTKGDANDAPDSEPVNANQIVGKVIVSASYLGYPVAFAKSKEGFVLLIVIPATLIIYSEILNIKNEIKKLRKKKKK